MSGSRAAFEAAKALYENAVRGLRELKWEDVPAPVRKYIQEHPGLSALNLVLLLVITCPGLVVTPMLGWIGFSSIGPVAGESLSEVIDLSAHLLLAGDAGSFAAWYQSVFGATWIFSGFQSAAMAGYAAGVVNGAFQGAAAITGGMAHWFGR